MIRATTCPCRSTSITVPSRSTSRTISSKRAFNSDTEMVISLFRNDRCGREIPRLHHHFRLVPLFRQPRFSIAGAVFGQEHVDGGHGRLGVFEGHAHEAAG